MALKVMVSKRYEKKEYGCRQIWYIQVFEFFLKVIPKANLVIIYNAGNEKEEWHVEKIYEVVNYIISHIYKFNQMADDNQNDSDALGYVKTVYAVLWHIT